MRMTLADLEKREHAMRVLEYQERLRYRETPEGKAEYEAQLAHEKRMQEADARWAAENPQTPFDAGANAAMNGEERWPPSDLEGEAEASWLDGWDSEAPEEN